MAMLRLFVCAVIIRTNLAARRHFSRTHSQGADPDINHQKCSDLCPTLYEFKPSVFCTGLCAHGSQSKAYETRCCKQRESTGTAAAPIEGRSRRRRDNEAEACNSSTALRSGQCCDKVTQTIKNGEPELTWRWCKENTTTESITTEVGRSATGVLRQVPSLKDLVGREEPTPEPTLESTPELTPEPAPEATPKPTPEPTATPTAEPTLEPTADPTIEPTATPTAEPTTEPTPKPTVEPTPQPTVSDQQKADELRERVSERWRNSEEATRPTAMHTPEPNAEPTQEEELALKPTATKGPSSGTFEDVVARVRARYDSPPGSPRNEPASERTAAPTPEPPVEPKPKPTLKKSESFEDVVARVRARYDNPPGSPRNEHAPERVAAPTPEPPLEPQPKPPLKKSESFEDVVARVRARYDNPSGTSTTSTTTSTKLQPTPLSDDDKSSQPSPYRSPVMADHPENERGKARRRKMADEEQGHAPHVEHSGWSMLRHNRKEISRTGYYQKFIQDWTSTERKTFQKPIRSIVEEWEYLCSQLNKPIRSSIEAPWYEADKAAENTLKLMTWNPKSHGLTRLMHRPTSELRNRINWPCYQKQSLAGKKILVVGAGPGGLRLAIEARLNGADVTLLEGRECFTRMNVLHIWAFSREDLHSIGIKDMWPKFITSSDKMTVPIAYLQHALLRIVLILGVKVRAGCRLATLVPAENQMQWSANASCLRNASDKDSWQEEHFAFDAIVDGTGARGNLRSYVPPGQNAPLVPAYPAREKQRENYAITANFRRFKHDFKDQFAVAYQYKIEEFESKQVHLQNIVYFRSPIAHYMVATITKNTLLEHGVARNNISRGFLESSNIDTEMLLKVATTMAEDWGIPHKRGFYEEGPDSWGQLKPSCYAFEFTKMMQAQSSVEIIMPPIGRGERPACSDDTDGFRRAAGRYDWNCKYYATHRHKCNSAELEGGNNVIPRYWCPLSCNGCAQATCNPGDQATCADGVTACTGNECCPGGDTCPSADPSFLRCAQPKARDCTLPALATQKSDRNLQCSMVATGAMARAYGIFGKACKCKTGYRLSGPSKKCKGRKFKPQDVKGKECSCKKTQAILVVGDALFSPFWPEGTGANRAILGALQHTWNLPSLFDHKSVTTTEARESKFKEQAEGLFSKLKQSDGSPCSRCSYQEFMQHGYNGAIENVCQPGRTTCIRTDSKGIFDV